MATAARESSGLIGFLRDALAALLKPRLLLPILLLAVLLTASNIVILMNAPAEGARPGGVFAVAGAVRVIGLLVLAVAMLRMITHSPRRPFVPDAGFWLYALTFLLSIAATILVRAAAGAGETLPGLLLTNAIAGILLAPLAAWFVGLAVERPVPWSPGSRVRALPRWLPHFLIWTLLLVTPLAALHAVIDLKLIAGAGDAFWPLALADGPLSAAMAVIALALGAEAHRRVARS